AEAAGAARLERRRSLHRALRKGRTVKMTTLAAAVALLAAAGALAACTAAGPVQTPGITDPDAPATPVETVFDPADANEDRAVTAHEQEQWDRKQPREYTKADGT